MIIFIVLAVILVIVFVIFQQLLPVIIAFIAMLLFYFLYQVIKDRKDFKRYFNKNVPVYTIDYVKMILEKIPNESKIISKENYIVVLNESGAYLLYVTDYEGFITGNLQELELNQRANTKGFSIPNELINLKKIQNLIQKQIDIPLQTMIIVKNNCNLKIIGLHENVVTIRHLYYELRQKFYKKVYSIEKIDKIFDTITM